MCRAVKVLCVATGHEALMALKRAAVSADWELSAGATDLRGALDQLDVERPHALVAFGPFEQLVALAAERFPAMRIVTDRDDTRGHRGGPVAGRRPEPARCAAPAGWSGRMRRVSLPRAPSRSGAPSSSSP